MGPGWKVGNYLIDDPTGFARGTFGSLYVARRSPDDAKVAMKLVLLTNENDGRERLEAERHGAILQQQFEKAHGLVPEVYEYGPHREHLYIAMEFVEGKSLTELIKIGLSSTDAARHAAGICEFLERAHQFATTVEGLPYHRIVHADLKPDHILIAASGEMKVLDFGIAKALEKTTEVTTNNWSTVAYASPERLQSGGHVNVHADFWSLGVMLYEMVCGHLPYPSLTARHLRSQLEHAIRTHARPEPLPESCPPALAAIISKLMAPQVEHRYQSAAAIRDDLNRFLAGEQPSALVQYDVPATVPVRRDERESHPQPPTTPVVLPPAPSHTPVLPMVGKPGAEPAVNVVQPTEPFPAAAVAPHAAPRTRASRSLSGLWRNRPRDVVRRGAAVAVLLTAVMVVALEGGAWVAAERFRDGIDRIDGRAIVEKRREYDSIHAWGLVDAGLRMRVNGPLKRRLVALADGVIADYRRDDPSMTAADWRQANDAVSWALALSPWDRGLASRQLLCEAHLARFAARQQRRGSDASTKAYQTAIQKFEAAARADERSYDPYLGISNIASYALDDVDGAAGAIAKAEERGYSPGKRERAQLGDGYLRRADRLRRHARQLEDDDSRREELAKARDDYARCVERFEPIKDFGRSSVNFEYCRGHLDRITLELDLQQLLAQWVQ